MKPPPAPARSSPSTSATSTDPATAPAWCPKAGTPTGCTTKPGPLLLPRILAGRTREPVFLAERAPTRAVPTLDLCPDTGRARLSYRRAAELFAHATTPLAAAAGQQTGWTMHQLRHSALTHDAESGTNTPMLLARSRHASMRSLERYARPGPEALARHAAATDPAARRRHGR